MSIDKINPVEVTEEFMRENDLVFMDYYTWRVLGTRKQVTDFAREGMMYCEGCERDRLSNIYLDAETGKMICRDWWSDGTEDPYEGRRKLLSWEAWQAE